jgi:hypothetical protein
LPLSGNKFYGIKNCVLLGIAWVPSAYSVNYMSNLLLLSLTSEVSINKSCCTCYFMNVKMLYGIALKMNLCRWWDANSECSSGSGWPTHCSTSVREWEAYWWLWWLALSSVFGKRKNVFSSPIASECKFIFLSLCFTLNFAIQILGQQSWMVNCRNFLAKMMTPGL